VEKAPYFLVMLFAVIGWLLLQLVEEVRSTRTAVSYSVNVNRTTGEVVALIENESKSASVSRAGYMLDCRGGGRCLAQLYPHEEFEEGTYVEARPIPPFTLGSREPMHGDANGAGTYIALTPGARFTLHARLTDPRADVDFYFLSPVNQPANVYVYDKNTLVGILADNFIRILTLLLAICLGALVAYVIYLARLGKARSRHSAGTHEEKPARKAR
jgi:uncharacterized integral membrane protein